MSIQKKESLRILPYVKHQVQKVIISKPFSINAGIEGCPAMPSSSFILLPFTYLRTPGLAEHALHALQSVVPQELYSVITAVVRLFV